MGSIQMSAFCNDVTESVPDLLSREHLNALFWRLDVLLICILCTCLFLCLGLRCIVSHNGHSNVLVSVITSCKLLLKHDPIGLMTISVLFLQSELIR